MSMPKIPDINANINICRDDAINMVIASIAMEELSIAHILNAEGEKLQYVLGTLNDKDPGEITICDIMAVNKSIQKTLRDVIKTEMLLQLKMEDATELAENSGECRVTIKGRKIWRDSNNAAGKRPNSVVIRLLRDGLPIDNLTVSSNTNWNYAFRCQPAYSESGSKYTYSVDELPIPTGYKMSTSGFDVINTIEQGSITITGTKTWVNDTVGVRPQQVTINLLQNKEEFDTETISSQESPAPFSFEDVPQFDDEGNLYVYSVSEPTLTGYDTKIEGYNITNTRR